jgi:hypothetical protein
MQFMYSLRGMHDRRRLLACFRYLVSTIADTLLTRKIYDDKVLWTGFVVFSSFAMDSASSGSACELLLQLPANKLDELLRDKRLRQNRARERLQDYASRLRDRVINQQILDVIQAAD